MLPVVALPDTEIAVILYLRAALAERLEAYAADVTVGRFVNPTALPFVGVRRVGGTSVSPRHDQPRIDVAVWHHTDDQRIDLAQLCRAILAAADGDQAGDYRVTFADEFAGPIRLPDPADQARTIVLFTHELIVS